MDNGHSRASAELAVVPNPLQETIEVNQQSTKNTTTV